MHIHGVYVYMPTKALFVLNPYSTYAFKYVRCLIQYKLKFFPTNLIVWLLFPIAL